MGSMSCRLAVAMKAACAALNINGAVVKNDVDFQSGKSQFRGKSQGRWTPATRRSVRLMGGLVCDWLAVVFERLAISRQIGASQSALIIVRTVMGGEVR